MATRAERQRLDPSVFRLPVERIREGYYSDAYFNFSRELLEAEDRHPQVVMQVFQKQESVLGGIDEAIAVLKQCAGRHTPDGGFENAWEDLSVHALHEGDEIAPHETVMTIEGDYALFAHLETVYLGCLARRTLVMKNVREVAEALGDDLWGVRLDTSERLVDRALWHEMGDFPPTGVNEVLVQRVREALGAAGHRGVKIVVSGGFDAERIRAFEAQGVPVDAYGVGSSLLRGSDDFTADIVLTDGRPSAKFGRRYRENPRLELVS